MEGSTLGTVSSDISISRRSFYHLLKSSAVKTTEDQTRLLTDFVKTRTNCPDESTSDIRKCISYFLSQFKIRWQESYRMEGRFLQKNSTWLDSSLDFPVFSQILQKSSGRPKKPFDALSERTKRKNTEILRSNFSSAELLYAAQMSLRLSGQTDGAKVVKDVTMTTPKPALNETNSLRIRKLPKSEALSMFIETNLTREQYNKIRKRDIDRFPSYKEIQEAKKECYPDNFFFIISETTSEVRLQGLLNHTAQRLVQTQSEVLEDIQVKKLHMISKWGFDGSNQSEYKQKFVSTPDASDANIFITSLVPLQIYYEQPDNKKHIIWQNRRCSSPRFCRPIRFQFAHETADLSKLEKTYIDQQINQLQPSICTTAEKQLEVSHVMLFTMVDGKVLNAVTDTTSTQRCYICGLSSKDFNNLDKALNTEPDTTRYEFGISVLHAWIKFLECTLHIAYKLPLKNWQARGKDNKELVAKTKKEIQIKFKNETGLILDKPKSGFGTSNDGNTARRFFHDPEKSSALTGVSADLIRRFKIILQTLSSGLNIDSEKFRKYTLHTAQLYIALYSWYPMPPTIHKILVHSPFIIANSLLPIGQLSEEAQESSNKVFKRYRESFSRKMSREKTNEDILKRLLISSDPYISSLEKVNKPNKAFDKEVLDMLKAADISEYESDLSDNESDENGSI